MVLSGRVVTISRTRINCGSVALQDLNRLLLSQRFLKSHVVILVDQNTGKHCLPLLVAECPGLDRASVFEIEGGEASKSLLTANTLWNELLALKADRRCLLINLGGGVVTDLGGFVAAGFKRGIEYINIPTSLIGMVDAAIGGKTGINIQNLKNQAGFFYSPLAVLIDPRFLQTLPEDHIRSGFAEIIKSALAGDPVLWRKLFRRGAQNILSLGPTDAFWQDLIMKTVTFKNRIVRQDFREQKIRRILNFGHSIGHALESLSMEKDHSAFLHGDAVALGMIAETWLSHIKAGLDEAEAMQIISFLKAGYPAQLKALCTSAGNPASLLDSIGGLLLHDKKNREGQLRFTLISSAGKPLTDMAADEDDIRNSLGKLFEQVH